MKFRRSPRSSAPDVARASKFSFTRLRFLLFIVNFIKWSSACIVMGVASYFIHDFSRNEHTTYQEVIACTSIAFFLPTIPLAFHKRFTVQLIPLDYIYSHLWVTAFIFAAEDYNWMKCSTHSPPGVHSCTLKYVLESWSIIAVSFCVFATILQVLIYRMEHGLPTVPLLEKSPKSRPSGETNGTTENGTTTAEATQAHGGV